MKDFRFEEESHSYFYKDKRVPSVSEILSPLMDKSFMLPEHAERGTYVHKCVQLMEASVKDWEPRYSELEGYISAYQNYRKVATTKPKAVEEPLFSKKFGFAGTPDLVFTSPVEICDIKTGTPQAWHALQLMGYAILLGEKLKIDPETINRFGLYLNREGKYKVAHYENNKVDYLFFLNSLSVWREGR